MKHVWPYQERLKRIKKLHPCDGYPGVEKNWYKKEKTEEEKTKWKLLNNKKKY